jgi:hypothetical protein
VFKKTRCMRPVSFSLTNIFPSCDHAELMFGAFIVQFIQKVLVCLGKVLFYNILGSFQYFPFLARIFLLYINSPIPDIAGTIHLVYQITKGISIHHQVLKVPSWLDGSWILWVWALVTFTNMAVHEAKHNCMKYLFWNSDTKCVYIYFFFFQLQKY